MKKKSKKKRDVMSVRIGTALEKAKVPMTPEVALTLIGLGTHIAVLCGVGLEDILVLVAKAVENGNEHRECLGYEK